MAKRKKKRERGTERERGAGSGSLHASTPLGAAFRLQERAAEVGFDWPDERGPLKKVKEEVRELEAELSAEGTAPRSLLPSLHTAPRSPLPRVEEEIGDLLFAVVNLARKLDVDPGAALERASDKFTRRFDAVKRLARERGMDVGRASLEELDRLWDEVKRR
ncbi:MAG TPA: MazG nucleotide pyrophosphohydrolase domain-containing protein [Gemmatimonadales bacterium]|nr:MazG nucleotide pyrophosphohydrolase domain-containing protein [Gemmatimonadales bacterium]